MVGAEPEFGQDDCVSLDDLARPRIGDKALGEVAVEILNIVLGEELVEQQVSGGVACSPDNLLGDIDGRTACSPGEPCAGVSVPLI